ncbi:leucyl/phenylalanyl-tRNA--protein transferase [Geitlerinema sp. P-1104]|uniref:leucyl/phenylalanyl-tRNA--protein transferase n=1 Tax=Geitlerinema sp. P-1104 TaxID=2546230 RepID=UPI0014768BE9|nr:leucyl/phenylalanyl-tRNA--protein transferase [Geitlerinema sp. P-1104]NMG59313.1 leucyl/phenylalanyl-tRNA--protein transferase [Geitlerinema sp. P-1104]
MNTDLTHIIHGYSQGYFLMNNEDDGDPSSGNLGWYCSNERTLIPLDSRFRYPKSLRRVLNQERFSVAINQDFAAVVDGCANRESTWISPQLKHIYLALHDSGWAHSFETWQGDRLAGGILGIAIGAVFIGESMFFNIPDGSKVAMVKLVEHLRQQKFELFDVQLMNPHLARFGAHIIDDPEYKELLQYAIHHPCRFVP